jgi:hypothetical protein
MLAVDGKKRCPRCGITKSVDEFHRCKTLKDGLALWCKPCQIASTRRYQKANSEHVREQNALWYKNNAEEQKARARVWRTEHPGAVRLHNHNRDARERGGAGRLRPSEAKDLLVYLGPRCLCCGATNDLTFDHVLPLAKGGTHELANIQILCRRCNIAKGVRLGLDYRKK